MWTSRCFAAANVWAFLYHSSSSSKRNFHLTKLFDPLGITPHALRFFHLELNSQKDINVFNHINLMKSYDILHLLEGTLYPEFSVLERTVEKSGFTRLNKALIQFERFLIGVPYLAAPFCVAYGHPIEGVILAAYGYIRIFAHTAFGKPKKLVKYVCNLSGQNSL